MKKLFSGVLVLGAGTLLAACSSNNFAEDKLIVAQGANPVSLLPWGSNDQPSSRVTAQIYDTLLVADENGNPTEEGGLAVSVENDSTEQEKWIITIDTNVKFQNGENLTSEDVSYSIESAAASSQTSHIVGTLKQRQDKLVNPVCWSELEDIEGESNYFTHTDGKHYKGEKDNPVIIQRNCISDDAVVVKGIDTIEVTYNEVYAPFKNILTHTTLGIVNKKVVEELGEDYGALRTSNAIGTGPYQVTSWDIQSTNGEIEFESFSGYWNHSKYEDRIEKISIRTIVDNSARANALFGKQIHIAYGLQAADKLAVPSYDYLEMTEEPNLSYTYIGFNMLEEKQTCGLNYNPFAGVITDDEIIDEYFTNDGILELDKAKTATGDLLETLKSYALRQSINLATDSQAIIDSKSVSDGAATLASSPVSNRVFGYSENVKPYGYDLDLGKELAEFAGYEKDGNNLNCEIWLDSSTTRKAVAEITHANLLEIGINLQIVEREWSTYLNETALGNHDMFILGWTTVTGDADYGLYGLFHSVAHGSSGNRTFYSNDNVDYALDLGRTSPGIEDRLAAYETALLNIKRDAPNVSISNGKDNAVYSTAVKGFELDRSSAHRLYKITAFK